MSRRLLVAMLTAAVLALAGSPATAQPISPDRLNAIYQMSAEDMAASGMFTRSAYERLLGYLYQVYQQAGFDKEAAKALVRSVIADSSAYEVPKR